MTGRVEVTDEDRNTPVYRLLFDLIGASRDYPMRKSYGQLADEYYSRIASTEAPRAENAVNAAIKDALALLSPPTAQPARDEGLVDRMADAIDDQIALECEASAEPKPVLLEEAWSRIAQAALRSQEGES